MANQRDKSKVYLSGWIPAPLKLELQLIAAETGKSTSDVVREFIQRGVDSYGVLNDAPNTPMKSAAETDVKEHPPTKYPRLRRRKRS